MFCHNSTLIEHQLQTEQNREPKTKRVVKIEYIFAAV